MIGDCFQKAASLVMWDTEYKDAKVVHAMVHGQGPLQGEIYGHAWIELGDLAIDKSSDRNIQVPKELYYMAGKVTKTRVYNRNELFTHINKTEHWGPWEKLE